MNDYQLSVLKVHFTALLFGLTGVFGVLIQAGSDVLVLGRLLIAFATLSVYFLWRKQPIVRLNRGQIFNQISVHYSYYTGLPFISQSKLAAWQWVP